MTPTSISSHEDQPTHAVPQGVPHPGEAIDAVDSVRRKVFDSIDAVSPVNEQVGAASDEVDGGSGGSKTTFDAVGGRAPVCRAGADGVGRFPSLFSGTTDVVAPFFPLSRNGVDRVDSHFSALSSRQFTPGTEKPKPNTIKNQDHGIPTHP
ncbi:MAG: hypothetical protein V4584_03375 [Verrucomicrobiota bacterium]